MFEFYAMQSIQKALVHSFCFHYDLDRVELDVEYMETDSAALSTCFWMGKMDNSFTVIFGSNWSYTGCFSFYVAHGYKR